MLNLEKCFGPELVVLCTFDAIIVAFAACFGISDNLEKDMELSFDWQSHNSMATVLRICAMRGVQAIRGSSDE